MCRTGGPARRVPRPALTRFTVGRCWFPANFSSFWPFLSRKCPSLGLYPGCWGMPEREVSCLYAPFWHLSGPFSEQNRLKTSREASCPAQRFLPSTFPFSRLRRVIHRLCPYMAHRPAPLDHPFHCWSLKKRLFVRDENLQHGSYTGGRPTMTSTPVSLLVVPSAQNGRHTFSPETQESQKRSKDTRLAMTFWQKVNNWRFWEWTTFWSALPLGSHLPGFYTFNSSLIRNPGKTRGLREEEDGVKRRPRTLRGVREQLRRG